MFGRVKDRLITEVEALPSNTVPLPKSSPHRILGCSLYPPFPVGSQQALFGLGCFWGAERLFWSLPGVFTTAVGYAGGYTANPSYEQVCSGLTAHTEVIQVVWMPSEICFYDLLKVFWEAHDPTQGLRQGNDVGSQYRSAIYVNSSEHFEEAQRTKVNYEKHVLKAGLSKITTEIRVEVPFYYAEEYHQQYLAKNPSGYCGLRGTGVSFK